MNEDVDDTSDSDEPEIDCITEDEDPEIGQVTHCLPFKVMGVTYNTTYQKHLEAAKAVGVNSVHAKIVGEPENEHDSNAIAVLINYGCGFVRIGYIAKELTRFIHPLLSNGTIVSVDVKHKVLHCVFEGWVLYNHKHQQKWTVGRPSDTG